MWWFKKEKNQFKTTQSFIDYLLIKEKLYSLSFLINATSKENISNYFLD